MHKLIGLSLLVIGLFVGQFDFMTPAFASEEAHAAGESRGKRPVLNGIKIWPFGRWSRSWFTSSS